MWFLHPTDLFLSQTFFLTEDTKLTVPIQDSKRCFANILTQSRGKIPSLLPPGASQPAVGSVVLLETAGVSIKLASPTLIRYHVWTKCNIT